MTNTKKQSSYEVITNKIIEKMQQGIIPWVKPWHADTWKCDGKTLMFPCFSHSNGKRYNLMNHMLLDFTAGEYATFQQIKAEGGKVKKGEKGQIITGWIVEKHERKDENGDTILTDDGKPSTYTTFALRYYTVFNILTQCEGITPKHDWTKDEAPENNHDAIENAENIIAKYINSADAPTFKVVKGSDEAYYSPAQDLVVVPDKSQFDLIEGYYGTTFHELTHSTLKESRCNRKSETKKAAFGSKEYSREELVAEMGSAFLSNHAGLDTSKTLDNSVAYLQSWIKKLQNDPKMIIQASSQAEKAAEYILNA